MSAQSTVASLIQVIIKLVNPSDPYTRIAAVWLDTVPPVEWTRTIQAQNTAYYKEFITSGRDSELRFNMENLPDGDHKLYLAVSQDEKSPGLGVWSGIANIGGITKSFDKVDFDTLARFDFTIKSGKVATASDKSGTTTVPQPKVGGWQQAKTMLWNLGGSVSNFPPKEVRDNIAKHKWLILLASAGAGAGIGSIVWLKKKRRY